MVEVHAYIEVTDAARGIAFYCDGLGLTVKRRFGPRWIELAGANLPVFLLADRPPVADLGTTVERRGGSDMFPAPDDVAAVLDGGWDVLAEAVPREWVDHEGHPVELHDTVVRAVRSN